MLLVCVILAIYVCDISYVFVRCKLHCIGLILAIGLWDVSYIVLVWF